MRIARYTPDRVVTDIQTLTEQDYRDAVDHFVDRFRRVFPFPAAFYQFGQVSCPGVSDIDLLIVCRDENWFQAHQLAQEVSCCSDRMRYLFIHPPDVVANSALPHLAVLHTLHGLTSLNNIWDPVFEGKRVRVSEDVAFIQHAVWNSCFRAIAPIFLDTESASMRQVLIRLKNLISSAQLGNGYLSRPRMLELDASEMRRTVLDSGADTQQETCKRFIQLALSALDDVDRALDSERSNPTPSRPTTIHPTHNCLCVAPLDASIRERARSLSKSCPGGWVISVPQYLVDAAAAVSNRIADAVPPVRPLCRPLDTTTLARFPGAAEYAKHIREAYLLSARHGVPFVWPMPFGIRSDANLRQSVLRHARKLVGAAAYAVS
jgi:hypothetical protein